MRSRILESLCDHSPGAGAHCLRNEARNTEPDVGERRERDERLRQLEREQASLEPEAEHEHQRQRYEEHQTLLLPSEPQMTRTGKRPGGGAD